jgi:type I restriction enzyme M protein
MSVRTTVKSIQDIMRQDSGVDGDAQRISQLCWMFFLKIIDDQDQQFELLQDGYSSPVPLELRWSAWASDPEGITGDELLAFINTQLFPQLKELSTAGKQGDRRRVVRDVFEDAYNYMKSGQLLRQVINKINEVDFNNLAERQHFGDIYEQILNDLQSAGNAGEYYTPRAVTAFMVDRIDPHPGETLLDPACGTGGFLTCSIRHMRDRYVKRVEDEASMQAALSAVEKKQLPHMLCVTNMLLHGIENPSFVRHDNTLARPYISYTQSDRVDIVLTNPPFGGREEDGIESNFPKHFQTRETADLFLALIMRILKTNGRAAVVLPDGFLFDKGVKTRLKEQLLNDCNLHTIVRLPSSTFKPYAGIATNILFFEKGSPTTETWFYEHLVPDGQKAYSMTKPIRINHFQPCIDWWGGGSRIGRAETSLAWRVSAESIKESGYNLDVKNPNSPADKRLDPMLLRKELSDLVEKTQRKREEILEEFKVSSSDSFSDHFARDFEDLTQNHTTVPKIRRFIVDLGTRGKLTRQDSRDEPAKQLLHRIRKQQSASGSSVRTRDASPSDEQTPVRPFEVPQGWEWASLASLSNKIHYGYTASADKSLTEVRLLRITDIQDNMVDWATVPGCVIATKDVGQYELQKGDILIARTGGTIGKTFLVDAMPVRSVFASYLIRVQGSSELYDRYLKLYLESSYYWKQLQDGARGAGQPNVNGQTLGKIQVEVPPREEQQRIVSAVEQLMKLCEELEPMLIKAEEVRELLLDAVFESEIDPLVPAK